MIDFTTLHEEYAAAGIPLAGINADGYPFFTRAVTHENPLGGDPITEARQVFYADWDGDKALVEQVRAAHTNQE